MEVIIYSTHKFEKEFLVKANAGSHELKFLELPLNIDTVHLSKGSKAVSIFVNDDASEKVLDKLHAAGVKFMVLRSAGFTHVHLGHAKNLGFRLARVPAYSPHAVAEHAVALMLALNRKLLRANSRVHKLNFSLDRLTGFDMNGKTAGIIGTGKIGEIVIKILHGFGCHILAVDQHENFDLKNKYNVTYTDYETLYKNSDINNITCTTPVT